MPRHLAPAWPPPDHHAPQSAPLWATPEVGDGPETVDLPSNVWD
jgi:hypothetical protein